MNYSFKKIDIKFSIKELGLNENFNGDSSVIIPVVKGTPLLKYGKHSYYFYNLKTLKCLRFEINHRNIILPALSDFFKSIDANHNLFFKFKALFQKYHYGFNFIEQIMLITVPHTVTSIGSGKFIINLWSYFGYLEIDCKKQSVIYKMLDDKDNSVLGSQQFFIPETNELYYITYSLTDSFKRIKNNGHPVSAAILKRKLNENVCENVWTGKLSDFLHDIIISSDRRYCVICELGMYLNNNNDIIPSKVLVIDLKNNKHWEFSKFIVAAHAQFDPDESDTVYFSNHNFNFIPGSIYKVLSKASYSIKFRGPAAIYKYKLTENGPQEIAVFTQPDFFRLTNLQVFNHQNQKIIAATSSPNFIFIIDAQTMRLIKKIEVNHQKNIPCIIGTISPSLDGEKLFIHTNRSFQIISIDSGKPLGIINHFYNHSCSNHMLTSVDVDW